MFPVGINLYHQSILNNMVLTMGTKNDNVDVTSFVYNYYRIPLGSIAYQKGGLKK